MFRLSTNAPTTEKAGNRTDLRLSLVTPSLNSQEVSDFYFFTLGLFTLY